MNTVIREEVEKKIARPWKKQVEEWHTPEEAKNIIAEQEAKAAATAETPELMQNGGTEVKKDE